MFSNNDYSFVEWIAKFFRSLISRVLWRNIFCYFKTGVLNPWSTRLGLRGCFETWSLWKVVCVKRACMSVDVIRSQSCLFWTRCSKAHSRPGPQCCVTVCGLEVAYSSWVLKGTENSPCHVTVVRGLVLPGGTLQDNDVVDRGTHICFYKRLILC